MSKTEDMDISVLVKAQGRFTVVVRIEGQCAHGTTALRALEPDARSMLAKTLWETAYTHGRIGTREEPYLPHVPFTEGHRSVIHPLKVWFEPVAEGHEATVN